jgi:ketosteroid isomerase-like protein
MTRWILILTTAVLLSAADPKADVTAAMQSWKTAMLKKDAAALDRLLHPDLTYSHSDARTETKADILQSIPAGKLNVTDIRFGDSTVRVYGNTALVKGTMEVAVTSSPTPLNLSVLQVWLKGPQGWQLVARQSTRLNK